MASLHSSTARDEMPSISLEQTDMLMMTNLAPSLSAMLPLKPDPMQPSTSILTTSAYWLGQGEQHSHHQQEQQQQQQQQQQHVFTMPPTPLDYSGMTTASSASSHFFDNDSVASEDSIESKSSRFSHNSWSNASSSSVASLSPQSSPSVASLNAITRTTTLRIKTSNPSTVSASASSSSCTVASIPMLETDKKSSAMTTRSGSNSRKGAHQQQQQQQQTSKSVLEAAAAASAATAGPEASSSSPSSSSRSRGIRKRCGDSMSIQTTPSASFTDATTSASAVVTTTSAATLPPVKVTTSSTGGRRPATTTLSLTNPRLPSTRVAASEAVRAAIARAAELTPVNGGSEDEDDEDGDSAVRKERNKVSASQYRKRRKVFVELLEEKVAELEVHLKEQLAMVQQLKAENEKLRRNGQTSSPNPSYSPSSEDESDGSSVSVPSQHSSAASSPSYHPVEFETQACAEAVETEDDYEGAGCGPVAPAYTVDMRMYRPSAVYVAADQADKAACGEFVDAGAALAHSHYPAHYDAQQLQLQHYHNMQQQQQQQQQHMMYSSGANHSAAAMAPMLPSQAAAAQMMTTSSGGWFGTSGAVMFAMFACVLLVALPNESVTGLSHFSATSSASSLSAIGGDMNQMTRPARKLLSFGGSGATAAVSCPSSWATSGAFEGDEALSDFDGIVFSLLMAGIPIFTAFGDLVLAFITFGSVFLTSIVGKLTIAFLLAVTVRSVATSLSSSPASAALSETFSAATVGAGAAGANNHVVKREGSRWMYALSEFS